jgi:hypothetical protein
LKKYGARPGLYDTPITNSEKVIQAGQKSFDNANSPTSYDIERFIDMSICVPAMEGSELVGRSERHELVVFKPEDYLSIKPYLSIEIPDDIYVDRVVCLTKSHEVLIAQSLSPVYPFSGLSRHHDPEFPQDEKLISSNPCQHKNTGFYLSFWPRDNSRYEPASCCLWNINNSKVPRVRTNIFLTQTNTFALCKEITLYANWENYKCENRAYGARLEIYGRQRE